MTEGIGQPQPRVEIEPGVFATGTAALQALAADAAVQALGQTPAPLSLQDELLAAVTGSALRAVVAMRVDQIAKHGHTAEDDGMLPPASLLNTAKSILTSAIALTSGYDRDLSELERGQRCAAKAAAMCMAAHDRIGLAIRESNGGAA
jgi:hypothetical protein